MTEDSSIDTPRTAAEIARRVIAVHCAIAAAHGVSKDEITEWLKEERLWDEVTPRELRFISQDEIPRKEVIWMSWLVELGDWLLWSVLG